LVFSAEILAEYIGVGQRLAKSFPAIDINPILALVVLNGELIVAPPLEKRVCGDAEDDMFFACAFASGCSHIISGDHHLQRASGFKGIVVSSPRDFLDEFL
jgi:predicted nucleic acid-binding protein